MGGLQSDADKPRLRPVYLTGGITGSPSPRKYGPFLPVSTETTEAIVILGIYLFIHSFVVIVVCMMYVSTQAMVHVSFLPSYGIGNGTLADRLSGKCLYP